jgi:hypothetical protein
VNLNFPKGVERLPLADYMPEMAPQELQVWINPPMATRLAYFDALREAATTTTEASLATVYRMTADLLSQGPDDTHWTVEEVQNLVELCAETDPRFWPWLIDRIVTMIEEHRA